MLVLFSDVHLTDGTAGESISGEAFDHFVDQIADLAERRRAHDVRVVLLGDGLDVIRSGRWLEEPRVRPWTHPSPAQRRIALDILDTIVERNREAVAALRELSHRVAARSRVPCRNVTLDYVLGNHDWIINRYRATRQVVADALDLPPRYVTGGFPLVYSSPPEAYDVVARHGDVYDRLNCDGSMPSDASSLGDAVVIELICRFPIEVGRALGHRFGEAVKTHLQEVDSVRPYTVIPAWVAEALAKLVQGHPDAVRGARTALARCIRDFERCPRIQGLVRRQLTCLERLYMRLLLHQVQRRRVRSLNFWTRLADRVIKGYRLLGNLPGSRYCGRALHERLPDGRLPRFVVYGHTHHVESVPIGPSRRGGDRFYLNTGTWRSVWEKSRTADGAPHFASWKEMSYVVLYAPEEGRGSHEFEMWSGSLRDRPASSREDRDGPRPAAAPDAPAKRARHSPVRSVPSPAGGP